MVNVIIYFQIRVTGKFKETFADSFLKTKSPLWNTSEVSNHSAYDGLWLVEPHAGQGPVGAKWEEILVIEDGKARWLEEAPPHVRQVQNSKD